jgi:hypothetical protein
MSADVRQVLQTLVDEVGAEHGARPEDAERMRAAIGGELPDELRAMYEVWNGGEIGGLNVYDLEDAAESTEEQRASIPFGVFFGDDGGDGTFFVDATGELGARGAVYWSSRGALVPADAIPAGDSLAALLAAAGRGERPWTGPSLRARWIAGMETAFAGHRDRWTSDPIPTASEVSDGVVFRLRGLPSEVPILLRAAGSPRFPGVGVTVLPMNEIVPVEGARAWWFARGDDGTRYAVTGLRWRDPDGGRVVRVGPGEDPKSAPIIGPLPLVVTAWLEGEKR